MDHFDVPATADRTFIYLSFSEKVPVDDYVLSYLNSRKLKVDSETVLGMRERVARLPGSGPLYKADVDYFFDTNVFKAALAVKWRRFA